MVEPRDPFDEQAAQRADENRAHDIAAEHAPLHARGAPHPANQNAPLTPEEKRELFARYFPTPEHDRSRDKERDKDHDR
jgi:hypothetical protein